MSYNGSGTFQINTSGQPVVAGTVISSTAFNALTADLATGLSTAITKDGQTTTTARIPFAAGINSSLTTDSTNSTSGSIITAGGVGIAKALYVGTTANVAGAVTLQSTLGVTGVATFSAAPIYSSLTASSAVATDASKALVSVTNTGTGNNVLATSPTITTPTLSGDTIAGTINGLTVGKGAGAVSTNTAVGASALAANSTGNNSTAIGYETLKLSTGDANTAIGANALDANTSGSFNSAVGRSALGAATTANNNSAFGYLALLSNTTGASNVSVGAEALYSNTTASNNTAVGYQAGYSQTTPTDSNTYLGMQAGYTNVTGGRNLYFGYRAGYVATGSGNLFIGYAAGQSTTTGSNNTFVGSRGTGSGDGAGFAVTTGSNNTIIGQYGGNQGSLDIRTASNYIVLSDGDGNPRAYWDGSGNLRFTSVGGGGATVAHFETNGGAIVKVFYPSNGISATQPNAASTAMQVWRDNTTARSINAAGTININGNDYAEYMAKSGDFAIAKGAVCGINAEGKLTNVFSDAISFCVKSTDPGLVGGDSWFTEPRPKDEDNNEFNLDTQEYAEWFARMETARATVDRIAFAGQVPVNVLGATAGQYIIPVNDNGAIKGQAVSSPTFEQYQIAVGKVIAIESDGRAKIIVKVA